MYFNKNIIMELYKFVKFIRNKRNILRNLKNIFRSIVPNITDSKLIKLFAI